MNDKLLRRIAYAASAFGVLPMYLMLTYLRLPDVELEYLVLSVVIEALYLAFVPALIAALTVTGKRDARSAKRSVMFFLSATLAEAVFILLVFAII